MSENKNTSYDKVTTNIEYNRKNDAELDPYEINFKEEIKDDDRGPHEPFVNEYGVLIGDHEYQSQNSPLENWNADTDPSIMSGDQWVHPYKDVGFQNTENRELFEKGIAPQAAPFMHPDRDVAYQTFHGEGNDPPKPEKDSQK